LTNLRRSASAASGPGIVIVIIGVDDTLCFLMKGLHSFILTNISNIVLAKTLMIGAIGDGKKLDIHSIIFHLVKNSY
jgi:hypothetical protein